MRKLDFQLPPEICRINISRNTRKLLNSSGHLHFVLLSASDAMQCSATDHYPIEHIKLSVAKS